MDTSTEIVRDCHSKALLLCGRPNKTSIPTANLRGSGGPPIDWIYLKTSENYAQKCIIFA